MGTTTREAAVDRIVDGGVIAVLRGLDRSDVVPVASAAVDGGVTAVEVTTDTPGAIDQVAAVAEAIGDEALVGAGTVLDAATAEAATEAGATFLVSPTVETAVIEAADRLEVAAVPGAATPTEALGAHRAGADLVKLFPAAALGPSYLAALGSPLGDIDFVPTGGVDATNAGAFIDAGAVAVGAGGGIVDREAVARGDYGAVRDRARALVEAVEAAR